MSKLLCSRRAAVVAIAVTCLAGSSLVTVARARTGPRFYDDDPLVRTVETQDASGVQPREISLVYDAVINLFGRPGEPEVGRAASVNTIDDVPDSSWFTNRAGSRPITVQEMLRGPSDDIGPAAGTWTVSRKGTGASPGFTITDAQGRRYFVKFDPPGLPELGTGAETVVTRLLHALGYHIPQVNIGTLRRQDLVVAQDATVRLPNGGRRPMRDSDIEEQLNRVHRNPDGTYRATFSESVPGRVLEGFKYEGTRSDDPNDIVPHENRRELRGLRVFSAFVNHTDAKAINGLDTVITENGRSYVRHYVRDFNAALGSAGVALRERRDGYRVPRGGGSGDEGAAGVRVQYPSLDAHRVPTLPRHRPLRVEGFRPGGVASPGSEPRVRCGRGRTTRSGALGS